MTTGLKTLARTAALAATLSVAVSGMSKAETLAQTLVDAYEHSGLLDQNRALLRAADENVAQILAGLRPIINYTADLTRSFGENQSSTFAISSTSTSVNVGIGVSLLLYDGGSTRLQLDSAKESVLATRQALISVEQQVLLRAIVAYQDVLRNQEFVSLRDNNLRLLSQELRAANDRFEVGEVTRTDVAQAEARLASARSEFAAAEGDLEQARQEFRAAVGRLPGTLSAPRQLPNLSGNIDEATAIAVRSHPDILQAQRDVAAAELNIRVAKAATRPNVSLQGNLSAGEDLDDDDFNRNGTVGVQVTGPIYQGGLLSSVTRQARANRDASLGNLHEVRRRIVQDVGNAYAILRATRASRTASREAVRAAEVAFAGVREEATLGARTTLDVLDAEQELLDSRATLISVEADVVIAAYSVLSSIGQLTAKDLNLDVQTYDPAAYYNLVKDAPVAISPQGQKLDRILRALGKEK